MAGRFSGARPQFVRGLENTNTLVTVRSMLFNLDNGAAATIDDVLLLSTVAVVVVGARILYTDATTGTVAGANAKIGTTVGGGEIVAATAYENTKVVGSQTLMTIVAGAVAANTPIIVRHTGIAATTAGQAYVEIEYREA